MRKTPISAMALVCLLGSLAAAAAQSPPEGIAAVDARWIAAMKANDVAAVMSCYAPDAVAFLPDAPTARGTEAIRGVYTGMLGENAVAEVGISDVAYATSGNLSSGWGHFMLTLKPKKGGEPVRMNGRFVATAKKIGGQWLYVADHASLEPPPPSTTPKP